MNTLETPTVPTQENVAENNSTFDRDMALGNATLSQDMEDDKFHDELFSGFAIHDSTQPETTVDEDHDELPDDLKDELGEPDNDEAHEQ